MKKCLIGTCLALGSLLIGLLIYFLIVTKDRNPGFTIDLTVKDSPEGQIHVGFAALSITPEVPDRWNDVNNDARYNPKDGDTYEDLNRWHNLPHSEERNNSFCFPWRFFDAGRSRSEHDSSGYGGFIGILATIKRNLVIQQKRLA